MPAVQFNLSTVEKLQGLCQIIALFPQGFYSTKHLDSVQKVGKSCSKRIVNAMLDWKGNL